MQSLDIECYLCDWQGKLKDYETHLGQAHPRPACLYCGQIFDSTKSLDTHQVKECDQITEVCALKNYGCSTGFVRAQRKEHYLTEEHQIAIISFIRSRDLSKFTNDQHERLSTMDVDTYSYTNSQLEETCQTIDILADGVQTLSEDVLRVNTESIQIKNAIDELNREVASLKLSIQEQNTYLDGLKPNEEVMQQDVASMKQMIEDMQQVSYNGTLVWKIDNISSKIADAKMERQTSIYSPPFYSSPNGYKMRVRVYLQGDGNARRTHMSLFFVLMRGEFDAILKFPFNYKVTFCLYDQTPAHQHIVDSFRPDTKSNSFQRPRSDMNIASGIPKFCSLSVIEQQNSPYVIDDTMFIKIMVDFSEISKLMLPFILNLNPGLPMSIHQSMIKQEVEKRNQQASTTTPT